ncbi:MAG: chorismate mutase [Promethearchaeota archaeon]
MEDIDELRRKIDTIDSKLVILINERAAISKLIGDLKNMNRIAVIQEGREKLVYEKVENQSERINKEDIRKIWKEIIEVCRKIQI